MNRRRDFLRFSAAAGLGLFASPAFANTMGAGGASGVMVGETFVFSEWLSAMERTIAAEGDRADMAFWRAFLRVGAADRKTDPQALTVLTLPAPGVELFAPAKARAMAALANDRLSARVRSANGRVAGFATLSASDETAVNEAERAISKLGLSGLTIGANRAVALNDRRLFPLYEFAQSVGAPIYLPASYAPTAGDIPYRASGSPGILAGAAAESARHAKQLIFGGVLDAFPDLTVVLARLGEAAPYWHAEIVQTHEGLRNADAKSPQRSVDSYFARNIMLTTADIQSPETLSYCASIIGADRLLRSQTHDVGSQMANARLALQA